MYLTNPTTHKAQLHSYVITDAIRDGKVLKFKVDYNNITPKFKSAEEENYDKKLTKLENKILLHPERISEIVKHILKVFDAKTHRNEYYDLKKRILNGFNAMFAFQSVEIRRVIRSNIGTRAKEELIIDFINKTKLSSLKKTDDILDTFYNFAKKEKEKKIDSLIENERLKEESKRFIEKAISKGYVEYAGDELDKIIPPTSRRQGAREKKKESVLENIGNIVEVFLGI